MRRSKAESAREPRRSRDSGLCGNGRQLVPRDMSSRARFEVGAPVKVAQLQKRLVSHVGPGEHELLSSRCSE